MLRYQFAGEAERSGETEEGSAATRIAEPENDTLHE
jgi:hypothetical protein